MINKDLIEYLQMFSDKTDVSLIVCDPKARKAYPLQDWAGITDMERPVLLITVGTAENMDDENIKHCDLDGQMNITDFPEVMP